MKTPALLLTAAVLIIAAGWAGWNVGHRAGQEEGETAARKAAARLERLQPAPERRNVGMSESRVAEARTGSDGELPPADSPKFAMKVREVLADPFESRRLARLQLVLEQCDTAQFAAMVPLIRENDLRGTGSGEEWELVMQNWARRDGAGVMDFIRTYDWKGWHPLSAPGAKYEALVGWATASPQAALAYFQDPTNKMRHDSNLQRALVMGWVAQDPEGAAAWVLQPEQSDITGEAHQLIVDAICRKGGQELLDQWFAGLPQDAPGLTALARAVATAKNRFQPDKASEWIESQKGKPWIEDGSLVTNTAMHLAARDPQAAMAWAGRTGSAAAANAVMQSWCRRDVGAASEWLKANGNISNYDQAATPIIQAIQREDPEAARAWAGTLKDSALRQQILSSLPTP